MIGVVRKRSGLFKVARNCLRSLGNVCGGPGQLETARGNRTDRARDECAITMPNSKIDHTSQLGQVPITEDKENEDDSGVPQDANPESRVGMPATSKLDGRHNPSSLDTMRIHQRPLSYRVVISDFTISVP
ncbi:hypothetical protein FQR65_LT11099 [Abscondita terminalis]|nr:hypothetical protein FQR65_LT11099 [Abscondita terminalis]